jgi:IS5 family transposase
MTHFQHQMPIDPSSMTRWRKRLGAAGAEQMLRATIEAGMAMRVIGPAQLKRINVDTTVQTKAIRFPTDARLYQRMREKLVKTARAEGLSIKQSYEHVGRRLLMQSSRYAHARQMKRARACTRKLKTQLGRIVREIERQIELPSTELAKLLETAHRIHLQQRHDKNKLPEGFPNWVTVYSYFAKWSAADQDGTSVLERALKKIRWRGPRETGAQRHDQLFDR